MSEIKGFTSCLRGVFLGVAVSFGSLFATLGAVRGASVAEELSAIQEAFDNKIEIHATADESLLPRSWRRSSINGKITPISDRELRRFPKLLREALSRYPKSVITKNLKRIVLLESISFYGLEYGATYSTDTVYLSSKGEELGYTDRYLVDGFHHEFSSILFRNYRFPTVSWEGANPRDFRYTGSGVEALRLGKTSLEGNETLYRRGILAGYSESALEEDFNVYSGIAFSQPERLRTLVRDYPIIRDKFRVWLHFYQSIDPFFTENRILNPPRQLALIGG